MLGGFELLLIVTILAALHVAVIGAILLAKRKGRDPLKWAFATAIFFPAVLVLLFLKRR